MRKIILITFLLTTVFLVNAQRAPITLGINSSVMTPTYGTLHYSSGIKVRIHLADKYSPSYKYQSNWYAETGVAYVYGKTNTFQLPVYVLAKNQKILRKFQRFNFYNRRKPVFSLVGKFGTIINVQKLNTTTNAYNQNQEPVVLNKDHGPLNMNFSGGWALERASGNRGLILGVGINFHSGSLFGSGNLFRDYSGFANTVSSSNYLSLDVYAIKTGRLKKFKPRPPCKCLPDRSSNF